MSDSNLKRIGIFSIVSTVILLVLYIVWPDWPGESRVWHSLLFNYLFFTGLAAGLVVWPSVVVTAHGSWMGSSEKICWTGLSFSLPSLVTLVVLWANSGKWAPWTGAVSHAEWWLSNNFLFIRNLLAQVVFWAFAFWVFSRRTKNNFRTAAGWLVLIYALTFSLMGFDLVMSLDRKWYSMMMGGYIFISGLYIAVVAWTLLTILIIKPGKKVLHDLGKLIIAFCMLTSYLMFSQLLPIWFENMPNETSFLVPRMNLAWKNISYFLLVVVYLGPVAVLLSARIKKNPVTLGIISLVILVGLWIERWWLVSAVFNPDKALLGWAEILPALMMLTWLIAGIALMLPLITGYFKTREMAA